MPKLLRSPRVLARFIPSRSVPSLSFLPLCLVSPGLLAVGLLPLGLLPLGLLSLAACSLVNDPLPSVDSNGASTTTTGGGGAGGEAASTGGAGGGGAGGASVCGDGEISGDEECDTKGDSASCDFDCTKPACGDEHRNVAAGEACDDGNDQEGDACGTKCLVTPFVIDGKACFKGEFTCVPDAGVVPVEGKEVFVVAWAKDLGGGPVPHTALFDASFKFATKGKLEAMAAAQTRVRVEANDAGSAAIAWTTADNTARIRAKFLPSGPEFDVFESASGFTPIALAGILDQHCVAWGDPAVNSTFLRCFDSSGKVFGSKPPTLGPAESLELGPVALVPAKTDLIAVWAGIPGPRVVGRRTNPTGALGMTTSTLSADSSITGIVQLGGGLALSDGSYVIANTFIANFSHPTSDTRAALRRILPSDLAAGPEVPVLATPELTAFPALAGTGGAFVAFYTVLKPMGCSLHGQKFNADLSKDGPLFLVASNPPESCPFATGARATSTGDVIVVWAEVDPGAVVSVHGAIYPGLVPPKS